MDRHAFTGCSGNPCQLTFPSVSYQPFGSATNPRIYECLFCARFGETLRPPSFSSVCTAGSPSRLSQQNRPIPLATLLSISSSRSLPPSSFLCTTYLHETTRAQHLTMSISLGFGLKVLVAVPRLLSRSECPANVSPTTPTLLSYLLRRKPLCPHVQSLSGEWWNYDRTWKSVPARSGFHSSRNRSPPFS